MIWDDFLNSMWRDWRGSGRSEDRLESPEWIGQWLSKHSLTAPHLPSPQEMVELKKLRDLLLRIVQACAAGSQPDPEDLGELNRVMANGPVVRQIVRTDERYRLDCVPTLFGWTQIGAEIAASFAQTLADKDPARMRICSNPDCLWVYYDDTRNRSKRYCDDKLCGNLMKVRRFRARKKAGD
ncbi:CGNR zinc finger domain-containing protein [Paenibacillus elgii]|uniref:CGNR zinc finger domain-containing protein n=1 Tax=Paenibacillus elgii TaxID=189691 RepID=UPI000248C9EF|nr:ABATE domain-containing protein [Paenibacillus elgii]